MIYLLLLLVLVLLLLVFKFYSEKKEVNQHLTYITERMHHIISNQSAERLLLFTDEMRFRELLIEINRLLDYHHEYLADNARMRMSMNRMLSNVSHDLKTPLTVILGYVETIQHDQKLTREERDALMSRVRMKVIDVAGLINKFFDLAKLESGDWQLELGVVHINEVCRKAIVDYYDTLTAKGFEVSIDIPQEPIYMYADQGAITRILDNLLSNAIRYGKDGKMVGIVLRQDDENISIDVWDKGKGVKEIDNNRIFERLYTLEDSRSPSAEGSGIGLTIAKRLAEQMKGQITYSSIPFERTVFTIQFQKPIDT